MGLANYKAEVEKRLGYSLEPARPYEFTHNIDAFGWAQGQDKKWHFTAFIEVTFLRLRSVSWHFSNSNQYRTVESRMLMAETSKHVCGKLPRYTKGYSG